MVLEHAMKIRGYIENTLEKWAEENKVEALDYHISLSHENLTLELKYPNFDWHQVTMFHKQCTQLKFETKIKGFGIHITAHDMRVYLEW